MQLTIINVQFAVENQDQKIELDTRLRGYDEEELDNRLRGYDGKGVSVMCSYQLTIF